MHHSINVIVLVQGLVLGCLANSVMADHPQLPGVKVESLLSSANSWDGTPYGHYPEGKPEVSVLRYSIPAHTTLPWHTHVVPNIAYIVSGEITVEKQDSGEKRLFKAGEAMAEVVNSTHRGYTGEQAAELVVFYAGAAGLPLVIKQSEAK